MDELEPVALPARTQQALAALVRALPAPATGPLPPTAAGRRPAALRRPAEAPPVMVDGEISIDELRVAAAACDDAAAGEPTLSGRELIEWIAWYVRPRGSSRRGRRPAA